MADPRTDPFARLPRYLADVGIHASQEQLAQFRIHFDLLLRWNAKTNLTAVREPEEILRRHFAESAYVTKVVTLGQGTLLDIGSGAGFPGIPAKIMSPTTRVILVEAVHKKAAFLKEVARELGIPGIEVRARRFEELEDVAADWVTLRAVKLDPQLLASIAGNVPRGTLAAFLGAEDARLLGAGVQSHPIPHSERRVIAVGPCSTWNTPGNEPSFTP